MRLTASPRSLEPTEGTVSVHEDSEIRFTLDCSKATTTVSNLSIKMKNSLDNYQADIASDHFSSLVATRENDTDIALNLCKDFVSGVTYKLEIKFTNAEGDVVVSVVRIHCK